MRKNNLSWICIFYAFFSYTGITSAAETSKGWSETILAQMSLEDKVSQMFSAPIYGYFLNEDHPDHRLSLDLVERFHIGGFIFFQGSPYSQVNLINELQDKSSLPLLMSQDLEWGAGMRVRQTTTFPSMMALGATGDTKLVYAMARVIAEEVRTLGIHQAYAPVADINNNPENPIINVRSFGEKPALASKMCVAYSEGLKDGGVIATAKHFPGHGDTSIDSHMDLPVLDFNENRLHNMELVPFQALIDSGIESIMVGHLALPSLDSNPILPATLSSNITTTLLREKMKFNGLIVTDAMGMSGVSEAYGVRQSSVLAVEAGCDVLLMSRDPYAGREAIIDAVKTGRLDEKRIDASVLRILRLKEKLGLHLNRLKEPEHVSKQVASRDHSVLSEEIARRSLTLLRNKDDILPIYDQNKKILCVVLSDTDQPNVGEHFFREVKRRTLPTQVEKRLLDMRSHATEYEAVLEEISNYDLVLVPSFMKVRAWSGKIALSSTQAEFINMVVKQQKPTIVVSFGNPYILVGLDQPDAELACYSNCSASQSAAVQAVFGESPIHGRLPVTIPGLHDFGEGVDLVQNKLRPGRPEEVGMSGRLEQEVDELINRAIQDRVFPAASVAIGRAGTMVLNKGYGYLTFDSEKKVTPDTVFDLASLTKALSTTTAAMKLYENGKLKLETPVSTYFPEFAQGGKENVTLFHLLTHTAGLKAWVPFYSKGFTTPDEITQFICKEQIVGEPGQNCLYSDLGMIMMGLIIQKIVKTDIYSWMKDHFWSRMAMTHTGFRPIGSTPFDPDIVPTEQDKYFRMRTIQGEVHDETAYIFGGIAGHAGLFSSSKDIATYAFMLLNQGRSHGQQFLKPETISFFTRRRTFGKNSRGLGWDLKSLEGYSSSGNLSGPNTFGHLGFTGTSIWMDPDQDLFVILLTNRIYLSREEERHREVRSKLADIAFASIKGPPELDLKRYER